MKDIYEALLFYDDLPPQRRDDVKKQLEDEPELAEALTRWQAVRSTIREEFHAALPDRRLLVLYALEDDGGIALTADEQEALDAARDDIEAALEAHPALQDVVTHIQAEQADFDAAWADAEATVAETSDAEAGSSAIDGTARADRQPKARSSNRRQFLRIATTSMLVVLGVLVWFLWPRAAEMNTVTVAEGQTERVALVDGSFVRLVGPAELEYASAQSEAFDRTVHLNYGRAFFNVQSMEGKGGALFIVYTPTAQTTVTGTKFAVEAETDVTEVTLAEGEVRVGIPNDQSVQEDVTLTPGQRSRVERDAGPTPPEAVDLAATLDWTGLLIYRSTPASAIAQQLSETYGVDVAVAPALEGESVTATFDKEQPVDQVLNALAATLGASVEGSDEDGYRLVPLQ